MTMGERIKILRIEKGMTQEALGSIIGVQKAAIKKYEKGEVENIKRSSIKKMADALGVSPCYLMGWDEDSEKIENLAEEVKLIEMLQKQYGKKAVQLLHMFTELNELGKDKAIENISDIASIAKYTEE